MQQLFYRTRLGTTLAESFVAKQKYVNFGARRCLFLKRVAGRRPATLLKNRLRHRCFPMNFAKFLRTAFL